MSNLIEFSNPESVFKPYGAYSHAAVVNAPGRLLFTSGLVGETVDGVIPPSVEEQYRVTLENIRSVLEAHGATPANLVKLTTFLVRPIDPAKMREIRHAVFGDIKPVATMIPLPALAAPELYVEMEAVAAL